MARHPLSTVVGVSRARGPTRRMRDRNLHFHPPSDPHSRGLIIPDRYSLIYENGGGKRREDEGSRVLSLRSSLPLFVLGDVYRDIEVVGGWLLSVLA